MRNATMTDAELTALYRMEPEHINITDTAKIIRAELKAAFPDTKFSVRVHRYSMGQHINVGYVDGPPSSAVEVITNQFYGCGFDGMTDSTTYHDSDYKGRRVHFAGSCPNVSRTITDQTGIMARIRASLISYFGAGDTYHHEWEVLSSLDLRWETPERGVIRFTTERAR